MTKQNNDRCKKLAASMVLIAHKQPDTPLYQILVDIIEIIDDAYFTSDNPLSDEDVLKIIKEYNNTLPSKID